MSIEEAVKPNNQSATVHLLHHGAAASSQRGLIGWIRPTEEPHQDHEEKRPPSRQCSTLVYASHSVLNLAHAKSVVLSSGDSEPIWHVEETLCTETRGSDSGPQHVITCLATLSCDLAKPNQSTVFTAAIVSGFADGTISLWLRNQSYTWCELYLDDSTASNLPITCIDASWVEGHSMLLILVGTSAGATYYQCKLRKCVAQDEIVQRNGKDVVMVESKSTVVVENTAVCSVNFRHDTSIGHVLALIGTAAPRHNKIHVLHTSVDASTSSGLDLHYSGSLTGHEDWVTCMAWTGDLTAPFLATGSQDTRIRLWKFSTSVNAESIKDELPEEGPGVVPIQEDDEGDDDDENVGHDDDEEEGESRLDIQLGKSVIRVTLEALLMGHEEAVTSLCWYRQSKNVYKQDHLLVSSSMDRSILLWTPGEDGIWTPLTRVGSAGGILGGSVGSTLLGYLGATTEPLGGTCLIGHAYGGALHVWNLDDEAINFSSSPESVDIPTAELATRLYWRTTACITGHFAGVKDLCWEASTGRYLLTVSDDQTCRLWAAAKPKVTNERIIWVEAARPQVHGYNLAAVTSLSSQKHPHFIVTGADEKELRGFDAPKLSLDVLEAVTGTRWPTDDPTKRVERAYIPSLGLSNKATASEGAEDDTPDETATGSMLRLPLERDLGAVSLWPEVQKLFGHTSELYSVSSSLEARSVIGLTDSESDGALLASSCKARNEADASIRLWKAWEGTCHQVLSGGHKSTVASLAFSPDGTLLASSGKDRRLCLWRRQDDGQFKAAWAKESAHKRIVWSVHFHPHCFGDTYFLASGSRDGCVKIWSIAVSNECQIPVVDARTIHSFSPTHTVNGKADSVTAVSFCPCPVEHGSAFLALGLESGLVELWNVPLKSPTDNIQPSVYLVFPANICHKATVTKLAWRPCKPSESATMKTLASCSSDHGCRIFEINL